LRTFGIADNATVSPTEGRMSWLARLLGRDAADADDQLVVVPIPPLVTLLSQHEAAKGTPLTEEEVLSIRGQAVCMTMRRSRADELASRRGFDDINPVHAWKEWVRIRSQGSS
jgi:hypothetical protein